jgi:hypothetical protein
VVAELFVFVAAQNKLFRQGYRRQFTQQGLVVPFERFSRVHKSCLLAEEARKRQLCFKLFRRPGEPPVHRFELDHGICGPVSYVKFVNECGRKERQPFRLQIVRLQSDCLARAQ